MFFEFYFFLLKLKSSFLGLYDDGTRLLSFFCGDFDGEGDGVPINFSYLVDFSVAFGVVLGFLFSYSALYFLVLHPLKSGFVSSSLI